MMLFTAVLALLYAIVQYHCYHTTLYLACTRCREVPQNVKRLIGQCTRSCATKLLRKKLHLISGNKGGVIERRKSAQGLHDPQIESFRERRRRARRSHLAWRISHSLLCMYVRYQLLASQKAGWQSVSAQTFAISGKTKASTDKNFWHIYY